MSTNQADVPTGACRPPLQGIRVLDFSHVLAGPFCTRVLADLGADVVRVETSTRPERMGATKAAPGPSARRDRPPAYLNTNRSKWSICVNLKSPGGHSVAARLAAISDVLVENFSAGVMERLELGYERLRPFNPGLVYVSMSGYGHRGPRRDWTSMNMNLLAYSGLMMVTGKEGDPPTMIANSWNDYIGGLHACFAVLYALARRSTSGQGCYLDLSQFECSVATIAPLLLASLVNRREPPRIGNRSTLAAPQGCYRCAGQDQWCAISVQTDQQWAALVQAIGSPAWAYGRFASVLGRLRHQDDIDVNLEAWTSQLPAVEVEQRLKTAGVPAERMRRINEVVDAPDSGHVFRRMDDAQGEQTLTTGLPFSFSRSSLSRLQPAPGLGEHTCQILQDWLGLDVGEIQALQDSGALV